MFRKTNLDNYLETGKRELLPSVQKEFKNALANENIRKQILEKILFSPHYKKHKKAEEMTLILLEHANSLFVFTRKSSYLKSTFIKLLRTSHSVNTIKKFFDCCFNKNTQKSFRGFFATKKPFDAIQQNQRLDTKNRKKMVAFLLDHIALGIKTNSISPNNFLRNIIEVIDHKLMPQQEIILLLKSCFKQVDFSFSDIAEQIKKLIQDKSDREVEPTLKRLDQLSTRLSLPLTKSSEPILEAKIEAVQEDCDFDEISQLISECVAPEVFFSNDLSNPAVRMTISSSFFKSGAGGSSNKDEIESKNKLNKI